MLKNKIGFLGEGWGAVAAIKSLKRYFRIECFSSDKEVLKVLTNDDIIIESFDEFSSKVLLCAGYKPLIGLNFIEKFTIINIHYSLLPAYRGLHSTAWAILNGEDNLGLSIHIMNEFVDDGPIIYQKKFPNDQVSSATSFMEKMNTYIGDNLGKIMSDFCDGQIIPIGQNKLEASWVGKRSAKHNLINFHKKFEYCQRLFRVLQKPYPCPTISYRGEIYNVEAVKFHYSKVTSDIGRVLNIDNEGIWIKSADGYFVLNGIKSSMGHTVDYTIFKIGSYIND